MRVVQACETMAWDEEIERGFLRRLFGAAVREDLNSGYMRMDDILERRGLLKEDEELSDWPEEKVCELVNGATVPQLRGWLLELSFADTQEDPGEWGHRVPARPRCSRSIRRSHAMEFPPFDETLRPTRNDDGEQMAPEVFLRWAGPAIWEDTAGALHIDIPLFHRWLDWPSTPESIEETAQMMDAILKRIAREDPENGPREVIMRPWVN